MEHFYSAEKNVQMLLFLLKQYNIKKIVVSPGATNVCFVASLQIDPYFELYSCVDERSAAYMAVGMAAESEEPIVLSCTGATSSRNYMPALTEAYYRKLPIIAVTSSMDNSLVGHLWAQVTDRSEYPNDIVVDGVYAQNIRNSNDEWDCSIKLNSILQRFRLEPCGPVHINLATGIGGGYGVKELPKFPIINLYLKEDKFPSLPSEGNIGIFVGEHKRFSQKETEAIDMFCATNNAVVFCDHTSHYYGKYRYQHALVGAQEHYRNTIGDISLLIHIGEMSGDYDTICGIVPDKVWRVSNDGQFKDRFKKLRAVFAMQEIDFFNHYIDKNKPLNSQYLRKCIDNYSNLFSQIPQLPLSNILVAKTLAPKIPKGSLLYLGILNTLRSWNYFNVENGVETISNVGGFGIDGIMSSMIGASFLDNQRLCFAILGDLSFFYDMNCLGNRHIGGNVRILLINNGHGQEFENYTHAASFLGNEVNKYVAAEGHFGRKSIDLVKHYSEDLGFEYISAKSKDEFLLNYKLFVNPIIEEKPMIFEVFTNAKDENEALRCLKNIVNNDGVLRKIKDVARKMF